MLSELYRQALDAADEMLTRVYRLPLAKALDPQKPRDFLIIQNRLAAAIRGIAKADEARALARALELLDVDWPNMTEANRDRVIEAARKAVAMPPASLPKIVAAYQVSGSRVVQGTKEAFKAKFGANIEASYSQADARIINHAAGSQALYVRDEFGRRSVAMSNTARDVVARGLREGMGRNELAIEIKAALGAQANARSDAYWNMAAGVFVNRSRVYGSIASFQSVGIEEFEFEAVRDEVTSLQCRFMHGRVFPVKAAADRYDQVAASSDPEDVKTIMPWVRTRRNDQGEQELYVGNQSIATATDNPMGKLDVSGTYRNALDNAQLAAMGVVVPPLHANCRSTIQPVMKDYSKPQKPVRAKPGRRPPPAAPAAPIAAPIAPAPPISPAPANPLPAPRPRRPAATQAPVLPGIVPTPAPVLPAAPAIIPTTAPAPTPPVATLAPTPAAPGPAPSGVLPMGPAAAPAPKAPKKPKKPRAPKTPKAPKAPPAKAPKLEFQEGVHFQNLKGSLPPEAMAEISRAVADANILGFLEKNPLRTLEISGKLSANGVYSHHNGELLLRNPPKISLRFPRKADSYGESLDAGESWSISKSGKTQTEAAARTLVHELGHHVHIFGMALEGGRGGSSTRVGRTVRNAFLRAKERGRLVALTQYGLTSEHEYFAESFAAYNFEREKLEAQDPEAVVMVETVLTELNIPLRPRKPADAKA